MQQGLDFLRNAFLKKCDPKEPPPALFIAPHGLIHPSDPGEFGNRTLGDGGNDCLPFVTTVHTHTHTYQQLMAASASNKC